MAELEMKVKGLKNAKVASKGEATREMMKSWDILVI